LKLFKIYVNFKTCHIVSVCNHHLEIFRQVGRSWWVDKPVVDFARLGHFGHIIISHLRIYWNDKNEDWFASYYK